MRCFCPCSGGWDWAWRPRGASFSPALVGVFARVFLGPPHFLAYLGYVGSPPDYLHAWTANLSPHATLFRLLGDAPGGRTVANVLSLAMDGMLIFLFWQGISKP